MVEKAKQEIKTFPVKLLKNYRPLGEFLVESADELREPAPDELLKIAAGVVIHLPVEEARDVIEKKIAVRNDPIA